MSLKPNAPLAAVQRSFLAILPRIELHGRICFRCLKCPFKKEELIAEMVALCWKWFVRLVRRGKNAPEFVVALCRFAGYAVWSGRRLCGMEKPRDVLSPLAQLHHDFGVGKLPDFSTLHGTPLEEALTDSTQTPPPDAAAFRIDFPCWLSTWSERDRWLIEDLAMGERTLDVANKYGVCPSRVSQKRREFHQHWQRYHGELDC
jgi:hypothetical protein